MPRAKCTTLGDRAFSGFIIIIIIIIKNNNSNFIYKPHYNFVNMNKLHKSNHSLQNRRNFLRILGEWRRKGGEREARVAREGRSVKNPACPDHPITVLEKQW